MDHIAVTGGAGYIGSFTTQRLLEEGYKVTVLDNLSTGHREAIPEDAAFHRIDLNDATELRAHFAEAQYDGVIHFAAKSLVGESVQDPLLYYTNNVVGSLNLVEACKAGGTNRLVFSSTAAVYGEPMGDLNEDHQKIPINPYGNTKLTVERLLQDTSFSSQLRSVALRYFNACGADPEGNRGEDHDPETHLIPLVVKAGMGLRGALNVFGDDYPTPDGSPLRDYINVYDLADAHIRALRHCSSAEVPFDAFNVGTGTGNSVFEVIKAVEEVLGKPVPYTVQGRRTGDPAQLVANSSKLQRLLGWSPKVLLRESVEAVVKFFSKHPEGYNGTK